MKKFQDYSSLEKNMAKRSFEISDNKKPGRWGRRFIISSAIQGSIITGITLALVLSQIFFANANLFDYLLSFEGAAKLFFAGYILYVAIVVAVAITGILYNHLEVNEKKEIGRFKSVLVWIHFFGINVGGSLTTLAMMFGGLIGSGVFSVIGIQGNINSDSVFNIILTNFILESSLILVIGFVCGIIAYLSSYLTKSEPDDE